MIIGDRQSNLSGIENKWRIWTPSNLPAFFAAVTLLLAMFAAEDFSRELEHQHERQHLQDQANIIGTKLHGHIVSSVELVRGLAATIATEPDINFERFTELVEALKIERREIRNIAAAPNLIVSMVHPLEGNRAVLGLDFRQNKEQRAMALRAKESRKFTFAGPVALVQGGTGFIVRYPIFNQMPNGEEKFWGLLSTVIDAEMLYDIVGIHDFPKISFALVGRDGKGANGELFFGLPEVLENNPVSVPIIFGFGSWQLHLAPKYGWASHPKNVWLIRVGAGFIFLLVVVPIFVIGRLFRERGQHLTSNIANQQKLASVTKRLEMALQTSRIGIWEFDLVTGQAFFDDRMLELYGIEEHESITSPLWDSRLHPDDLPRVKKETKDAIHNGTLYKTEFRICRPDGVEKTIRAVGSMLITQAGERRLIGVNWDITEDVVRERELEEARAESERRYKALDLAQEKIRESALHDFLTGLPNRRYLDDLLHERLVDGPVMDDTACLIKIDLDGFKKVNDSYGHAAGDSVLVQVAKLLRRVIGKTEYAARIGGDEFVVLCQSDDELQRPISLCNQILEALHVPTEFNGQTCRIGASIGVARGADANRDPDKLLCHADLALYQSKQSGRGRYSFFCEPLVQQAQEQRRLADDLIRGIENREFVAFYQGQYSAAHHGLVGAEALARWQHPERGLLNPNEFIELAERLGVMGAIDAQVLDHAIATKKHFMQQGLDVPRMSVNVSAKRLGDKDLIPNLKKLDFDPSSLTFELVESTFLDRSDPQVAANIRQIRDMGIDIEIDDFGTAYASIVSLTHLLPNRLKIDRELIAPIIESADQRELVHSIIHIGRTLGIGSIAEGVESMEHADILHVMGAEILQGFVFCRPMSAADFFEKHRQSDQDRQRMG